MYYNFTVYVGTVPYEQPWSDLLWRDPDGNTFEEISDFLNCPKMKDDQRYFPMSMEEVEKTFVVDDPVPF